LQRRTGEAVHVVRQITEALARIGVAQRRAAARLADAAKRHGAAVQRTVAAQIQRVEQAREALATVIRQSRAASAGQRIADRVVSLADPDARPIKQGK
jgi:IS5 family transposase